MCTRGRYGFLARSAVLIKLLRVDGAHNIHIESGVVVQPGTWLAAVALTSADHCRLEIKQNAIIGNFNHIYATRSIVIESEVLIADKVYISDCAHEYRDVQTPILKQPIKQLNNVVIGQGAWIGENACVIGASVGKGSVVGANSVVLSDIPA
ncbi:MAG: acyltransferase, partial [Mucinivorans sp.]